VALVSVPATNVVRRLVTLATELRPPQDPYSLTFTPDDVNRERQLVAAAVLVVALTTVAAAVVPGVLADPSDRGPVRPGPVDVVEMPITEGDVTGETATLRVEARLQHRGNPTPNVTVRFRAVDTDTGLVTTTETVPVGDLTDESETPANASLTVPREGGYRIEAVAYSDDRRVAAGTRTVSGLEALTPPRARSTVRFAERGAIPPLSVAVDEAGAERTTLNVTAALTNAGDDPVSDLSVTVVLRQAESNVVAARRTARVGELRPGRTGEANVVLDVPAEYNYYVDAVLVRDGVVIDTARSVANLDPRRTISVNETEREVAFDAGDFTPGTGEGERPRPRPTGTPVEGGAPGFGPVVPVVAALVLASLALARRRWGR
jgi:hypothetical protein